MDINEALRKRRFFLFYRTKAFLFCLSNKLKHETKRYPGQQQHY